MRAAQGDTKEKFDAEPIGLQDRILDYLRLYGPSQAKQIAKALNVGRTTINQILHGSLKEEVTQTKNYNWQLSRFDDPESHVDPFSRNFYKNLFQYYL